MFFYLVNTFGRNRNRTAAIEKNSAGGDVYETVVYWGPQEGSAQVYNYRNGQTLMFWAENDDAAYKIVCEQLNKPVSGRSYMRGCRLTAERVREMVAYHEGRTT